VVVPGTGYCGDSSKSHTSKAPAGSASAARCGPHRSHDSLLRSFCRRGSLNRRPLSTPPLDGSPRSPLPPSACSRFTPFTAHIEALHARGSLRSPLALVASLRSATLVAPRFARDRPFRACGSLLASLAVPGVCPRRQRVSPSVAPLAGFRVPALGAAPRGEPRGGSPCSRQSRWTRSRTSGRTRAGLLRWPLAPGGSAARGWLIGSTGAPLAPVWRRAKARARARSDDVVALVE
jgi:hypothetical protein